MTRSIDPHLRRRSWSPVLLAMVLLAGANLLGQAEVKIGFVNTLQVLYGTEEGKQKVDIIQKLIDEKKARFKEMQQELARLNQQFQSQQATLNPVARDEAQRTIQEKERAFKRFQEDSRDEINSRRKEVLDGLRVKIQGIIDDFAAAQGYTVIFHRSEAQAYVDPALDVTQEIIRIFNEKYPVTAAKSPPSQP